MKDRIDAVRAGLESSGADAYVSVFPPDNQYLSGFLTSFMEISSGIIITATEALFLCDFRYTEQAKEEVLDFEVREIDTDLIARVGETLTQLGVANAAFTPHGFTVDEFQRLTSAAECELVSNAGLLAKLRVIKSADEITLIREASELAEGVMLDIVPTLEAGVLERDVAAHFEYEFKKRGATGVSFDTIALFGAKSSLPHGEPARKCLENGDITLFDFGCRKGGYCSDLTRTFVFGSIPRWFEEIYAITLNAQLSALKAVRPGAVCRDVDAVARDIISEGGYGEYFGHGLGHGVGIEIHESPRLNKKSDVTLQEGMVVTVEPGIYLPGKGGVRIEDLVVVTADGCDVLTKSPKELKVL